MLKARRTSKPVGIIKGFRSGLEEKNAEYLAAHGVPVRFEMLKLVYVKPARESTYTPDFELPNGIIVETKGQFVTADRQKHLLVQQQHPSLDIRFVFTNPHTKLYKGSKTSYADWCDKHGFQWASKLIPLVWIKEPMKCSPR